MFALILVEIQHCCNALRDGARREYHYRAVGDTLRLLRRHNDVFVVGQHKHRPGRYALHRRHNVLCSRVHRLPARDNGVHAQIRKDIFQPFARRYRDKAERAVVVYGGVGKFPARRGLGGGLLLQPLALRLARKELFVHVLNLEIRQITVLQRVADDLAWVRRVDVAVDHLVVLDYNNAVAVAL